MLFMQSYHYLLVSEIKGSIMQLQNLWKLESYRMEFSFLKAN